MSRISLLWNRPWLVYKQTNLKDFTLNNKYKDLYMNRFEGQIVVVTGASRGIGHEIALSFAREGADVACISRSQANSDKIAEEIRALGRKAWAYALDVSDTNAVAEMSAALLKEAGKVDVLVNNAGVTRDNLFMRMSPEEWDAVINTNLKGTYNLCKAFIRPFIKQRSGRIVNIASIVGLRGNAGQCNYSASKAALIGFSKSLAREVASRNITVNAVAPGFIDTDMTSVLNESVREALLKEIPMGAVGKPEDIAAAVLFLASKEARYITGHVLVVDGGFAM